MIAIKTRYSFRTVSDDAYVQTVYSRMYEVLEIDKMLDDVNDANEKVLEANQAKQQEYQARQQEHQAKQQKYEHRLERLILALSFLAIFSALVDFTDFLEKFSVPPVIMPILSLTLIVLFVIVAWLRIFRSKDD